MVIVLQGHAAHGKGERAVMTEHADTPYTQLYREAMPSVVSLYTRPAERGRGGAGSGFVYDADGAADQATADGGLEDASAATDHGYVVTNQHVVRDHTDVEVRFSESDWRTGRVVGTDEYTDLAVVRVDDLPAYADGLPLATDAPTPGDAVAALGNPMGLDGTISTGVVSGVNRSMPTSGGFAIPDTVQTDAPINPGNSGGPLVTRDGRVVGVNRARQGDNIGFAVSAAIVRRVVPDLVREGAVRHATLHVSTLDVSPTVAEANGLAEPGGVLVVDVREGPASGVLGGCVDTRTVRGREVPVGGDVLVGIDGRPLDSHEALMRYLVTECRPGDEVTLRVRRNVGETEETVTLTDRVRSQARPGGSGWRIEVE